MFEFCRAAETGCAVMSIKMIAFYARQLGDGCPIRLAAYTSDLGGNLPAALTGYLQAVIKWQTSQPAGQETSVEAVACADTISASTNWQDAGMALALCDNQCAFFSLLDRGNGDAHPLKKPDSFIQTGCSADTPGFLFIGQKNIRQWEGVLESAIPFFFRIPVGIQRGAQAERTGTCEYAWNCRA